MTSRFDKTHPDPPPEYNSWDEVWTEAVSARKQLAHAQSDLAQARETVRALLAAENKTIHCAFCGQAYPDGTPESKHERLSAHILVCEQHPLRNCIAALKSIATPSADACCSTTVETLRSIAQAALDAAKDPPSGR